MFGLPQIFVFEVLIQSQLQNMVGSEALNTHISLIIRYHKCNEHEYPHFIH